MLLQFLLTGRVFFRFSVFLGHVIKPDAFFEGIASSGNFCFLFAPPFTQAQLDPLPTDLRDETLVMFRAGLMKDRIGRAAGEMASRISWS